MGVPVHGRVRRRRQYSMVGCCWWNIEPERWKIWFLSQTYIQKKAFKNTNKFWIQKHAVHVLRVQTKGNGSSQDADANARFQKRFSPNTGLKKRQKRYAFHWNVDFQSKWSRFEKRFFHSKNCFRKRFVVPENAKRAACKSKNHCQKRF